MDMLGLFRAIFAPPRDLILLFAAGWAGLALADKWARCTAVGEKAIDAVVMWMLLAFVIGGRLFFLAAHFSATVSSPTSIVSLNTAAFDLWGGLASATIAAMVVAQRRRFPVWETLDALTPFFATLAIGISLSHLASGAAFGKETGVPWAINLWGAERHPTQMYELFAAIVILCIVSFRSVDLHAGRTFLLWVALCAASRLVIEGFRGDSILVFGGIRLAQIVAWIVLAAALLGLEMREREQTIEPTVPPAEIE
jgi:phosphatidylglycerol:prolipoprotein diacylglycerol transferase